MNEIKVSTAQFEHKCGDKAYNLSVIESLAEKASVEGSRVIAFHECSVTGYTFAMKLSNEQFLNLAEFIPDGESTNKLVEIAKKYRITVLAGLFEKDRDDKIFKAYICVDETGLIASHRKLHPFINPLVLQGDHYTVFTVDGWKCGILICYDNNVI
jgi:predicted amidohydrolase